MGTIEIINKLNGMALKLTVSETDMLKQVIESNYHRLFSVNEKPNVSHVDSWEQFSITYLNYSNKYFSFAINTRNSEVVHLIDRVKDFNSNNLFITRPTIKIDDSILFFIYKNYEREIQSIVSNRSSKDDIIKSLERLLSNIDSHIMIDNFSNSSLEYSLRHFVVQLIPSSLWIELKKNYMNYYQKFIVSFITQIILLDYCIRKRISSTQCDIYRAWIVNYLFKVQHLMLVTLNIPEIFLRNIYPLNYTKALKKAGIKPFCSKEEEHEQISGRSISEIYKNILHCAQIKNYYEYIVFCQESDFSDFNLRKIVHTFRIFHNKLKHSSFVKIIKSRDAEAINLLKLDAIREQIDLIENSIFIRDKSETLGKLKLEEEIVHKIKYAYADYDFGDSDFKLNNGILVCGENDSFNFKISIYDLEFSIKILIGILCILNRCSGINDAELPS